jgi:alkaline phosphatase
MANQILNKAVNESVWTSAIRDTLTDCGVESLTDAEISTVTRQQTYLAVGEIVNRRARVGFSTTGHTGIDVNVYAFGPGKENFYGNHNNIDLASKVANIFDLDLEAATKKL